ncbi:hypothetical protein KIH74_13590 [Kineosporia sp. J2-2]|uniref:Uncharacterized protein n=1 Tax=Kineosporia corallincola TaxID=2835133 RepID=A0ABS5TFV1_9ACTN|nr:hypothetical protein [Kineosporia corallincola]MBT0769965.1 hypothetical protein [Kineosporia corallincola]
MSRNRHVWFATGIAALIGVLLVVEALIASPSTGGGEQVWVVTTRGPGQADLPGEPVPYDEWEKADQDIIWATP